MQNRRPSLLLILWILSPVDNLTYNKALNRTLDKLLVENEEVILVGEDIRDPYGGAFKVTKGLSTKYPDRVLNTPISELAITGIVTGMAMRGMRPVLEIMFGDFLGLCMDQLLNHLSKFGWMYGPESGVEVPLVIRTPMGGRRGYGPTHSQTIEKLIFGIPGIRVVAPSHFHDVETVLERTVLEEHSPVLFVENKLLYSEMIQRPIDGYVANLAARETNGKYPTLILSNSDFDDPESTLVTYGGMLPLAVDAAVGLMMDDEIPIEIVAPSCPHPLDLTPILESVKRSKRLVVAEESTITNGWGSEVVSRVVENSFDCLVAPPRRIAALDLPIANTRPLEDSILPSGHDIKNAILESLG